MSRLLFTSLILPILASLALAGCATAPSSADVLSGGVPLAPALAKQAPLRQSVQEGLVSAADPRAAAAGAEMLRQGGSATDAAIATMLTLTVVEPQSSGIGGGGFFVHGTPGGDVTTIDGRETAPAAAGPDWFTDANGNVFGYRDVVLTGKSIGVPGNLRLAEMAYARHGKLAWAALFGPAIALAEQGFAVTPRLQGYLASMKDRAGNDPAGRALFYDSAGGAAAVGTIIRNPALAATLRSVAQNGPRAFYRGDAAAGLAAKIAESTPGTARMNNRDVETYRAKTRNAVCGTYRTYRICGMGPPSSGATTVLAILGQLGRFDLGALGPDNITFWHLFAESQRLAYADRERYLADSDFVPVPVQWLTDPAYLARRGAMMSTTGRLAAVKAGIAPGIALAPPDGGEPPENGTSHFVVVDSAGNAVSYTSTIEGPFGSGQMFGGFYLNNELTDFSFSAAENGRPVANRVEGGKRPRSSMAPTLVYRADGTLFLAVGAAGGGTIPVQTAKAIIAVVDFGLSGEQALGLPVLYSPGDTVVLEEGTDLARFTAGLEALGHTVIVRDLPLKANLLVCADSNGQRVCAGAADPRSEGAVAVQ